MRTLLLTAAFLTAACTFTLPVGGARADAPIVVPTEVPTGLPKDMPVRFAPPVGKDGPPTGEIYVCGQEDGTFFCIQWDLFIKSMQGGTNPDDWT